MSALMSGMSGGMDMSSDPMFRIYNQQLAEDYWYIIAGFCGFMLFLRGGEYYQNWLRLVGKVSLYLNSRRNGEAL